MTMVVTLTSGKKGDFVPAVNGTLRGESDFGQVDVPMSADLEGRVQVRQAIHINSMREAVRCTMC